MSAGFFIDLLLNICQVTALFYSRKFQYLNRLWRSSYQDEIFNYLWKCVMAEGKCGKVAVVFDEEMR